MTHFLQRSALILLATSALAAPLCVAGPALAKAHHAAKPAEPPKAANGKIVTLNGERGAYVVKKGDTLEKVADRLDTTVDELLTANKLKRTAVLQPGDVLKGPPVSKKAYVVAHGDTVYSIAQRFHVSVEELRAENDLSTKTAIRPGQKIRLPADYRAPGVESADEPAQAAADPPSKGAKAHKGRLTPAEVAEDTRAVGGGPVVTREAKGETYRAKKGDTLAKVADRLDVDVAQLKRLNHVKGNTVRAGQVFRGPSFTEHYYTAGAGETLAAIAQRFSVSVESLRAENELSRRVITVRQGQKVFLPDGFRDRSAPAPVEARPVRTYPQPSTPSGALPSHPQPYSPSGQRPYSPSGGRTYTPSVTTPDTTPAPTDAQVTQAGKGKFEWPLRGQILSDFGPKAGNQRNDGINIQADAGAVVRAAAEGDVIYAGDQVPGFGNLVLIKHAEGWATAYAHLAHIDVKNQQKVTQGQQVGTVGTTGGVPEPQLHFEVRYAGGSSEAARHAIDPKLVLPK